MRFFYLLLLFTIYWGNARLSAQPKNENASKYQLRIKKTNTPIKLDGQLDEPAWQNDAELARQFKLVFPNDTAFSPWPTEMRVCFDDQNIYVAARCRENRADYTVQSLRRDFGGGTTDVINVLFDPSKDGLNGFMFSVSPLNVQREGLISNGENFALEWDNKWYSAVHNEAEYWSVEMAIPFKTLRYSVNPGENSWGLQFIRTKVKDFETGVWAPVPFVFGVTNLAFAGRMIWDTPPPKPGANVSLIPYAIGGANLDYLRDTNLVRTDTKTTWNRNVGGDAKIALTPGLNLDLTINPDFSQVEVDRQVANLSRFELFFPELRQFFLENRDLFAMFGFPSTRPFFSRRIGLAYNPVKGRNEKVPILAGMRLSGKLTDDLRIGLLNMQTDRKNWSDSKALPAANFTVATAQQKVFERSTISGILVNKQNFTHNLNEQQKKGWQPWNRIAGLEYNLYSKDNRWEGEWYYHRSFSPDKKQRGSSLASFLGYSDRNFNVFCGYNRTDSTYTADAGFVPRPGVQSLFVSPGLRIYPKSGWAARHITNHRISINNDLTMGLNGRKTDHDLGLNYSLFFTDQSGIESAIFYRYTYLFEPFDPTNLYEAGTEPLPVKGYENTGGRISYFSGTTTDLQGEINLEGGQYFNGHILNMQGRIAYRMQPYGLFSMLYSYNRIRLPKPYASADFWLIGPRVELAFTRNLFTSAFFQYNTQSNNFNINARLQWRFAPVSDLFLVYTDNSYAERLPNTPVRFFAPKDKAIVLKVVYWLNV